MPEIAWHGFRILYGMRIMVYIRNRYFSVSDCLNHRRINPDSLGIGKKLIVYDLIFPDRKGEVLAILG